MRYIGGVGKALRTETLAHQHGYGYVFGVCGRA